jgi:hypothetical protein
MSGSMRMPVPSVLANSASALHTLNEMARPHDKEKRQAAVLMLLALFEEFPVPAAAINARADRNALLTYAERGWFVLLTKDAYLKDTGVPPDRIRAGITLLIG